MAEWLDGIDTDHSLSLSAIIHIQIHIMYSILDEHFESLLTLFDVSTETKTIKWNEKWTINRRLWILNAVWTATIAWSAHSTHYIPLTINECKIKLKFVFWKTVWTVNSFSRERNMAIVFHLHFVWSCIFFLLFFSSHPFRFTSH